MRIYVINLSCTDKLSKSEKAAVYRLIVFVYIYIYKSMDWFLYDRDLLHENETVEYMPLFYLKQRKVVILQLVVLERTENL